nr:EOG090X0ADZ [Daphnia magna]
MSLNTAHANNGVLIYSGECILLYCDNVVMEFSGQDKPEFKGDKAGRLYLTTHRMIFNNSNAKDPLLSFSFPFCTMKNASLSLDKWKNNNNYKNFLFLLIVRAQPNGGWIGEVKFKLHFKHGGAIEYGQAMLQAAGLTKRNHQYTDEPPAYQPPTGPWHDAAPPTYSPPSGYYGWVPPPSDAFPNAPPANSVYMTDMPPPYPGINTGGYTPSAHDAKAAEAAASGTAYYDPNTHYAYVPPAYVKLYISIIVNDCDA